jgi:hypothetical protein
LRKQPRCSTGFQPVPGSRQDGGATWPTHAPFPSFIGGRRADHEGCFENGRRTEPRPIGVPGPQSGPGWPSGNGHPALATPPDPADWPLPHGRGSEAGGKATPAGAACPAFPYSKRAESCFLTSFFRFGCSCSHRVVCGFIRVVRGLLCVHVICTAMLQRLRRVRRPASESAGGDARGPRAGEDARAPAPRSSLLTCGFTALRPLVRQAKPGRSRRLKGVYPENCPFNR